jgi:hypothetical protein
MRTSITRRPAAVSPRARRYRPTVETLEDRVLPALGPEFFVGGSLGNVNEVRTASSANGTSVAVWSVDEIQHGNFDVYGQRFDAFYNPVGNPFLIASSANDEDQPDVAMDANGNFVVVWRVNSTEDSGGSGSFDIHFSTRFSLPGGGSGGSGGIVADSSVADVGNPRVTMNAAGTWTVAFEAGALNGLDIFARRFSLFGDKLGGDIPVATGPLAHEFGPVIDGNAAGRFSIAYLQQTSLGKGSLFVKRYSPAGKLLGTSKIAKGLPTGATGLPDFFVPENPRQYDLAMDNAGNTTVVYAQATSLTGFDIFSRQITRQGVLGGRKIISNLAGGQLDPVIGMDRVTGRFVVAFSTNDGLTAIVQERSKKGRLIVQHPPIDTPTFVMRPQSVSVDSDGTYLIGLLVRQSGSGLDAYAAFGELP